MINIDWGMYIEEDEENESNSEIKGDFQTLKNGGNHLIYDDDELEIEHHNLTEKIMSK